MHLFMRAFDHAIIASLRVNMNILHFTHPLSVVIVDLGVNVLDMLIWIS